MTENDRILINAFVDDEASSEEIKYVEDLIEKNDEALKYLNMLKKANIEFNKFFEDIDLTKNFIEEKSSFAELILKFFQKPIFAYATTAAVFFGIGTQFIDNDFKESNFEFKYLELRSENNKAQLMMILDEMIKKEISTAKIDSQSYSQIIIFPNDSSNCVLFELNGNRNSIGKYCSETDYIHVSDID